MPLDRRNLPMEQPGDDVLRGLITFALNHFQQWIGRRGQQLVEPLQAVADMLADLLRPPLGITFANLDWRKKEHRLRAFDGAQSGFCGALSRAGETAVDQLTGKMLMHAVA